MDFLNQILAELFDKFKAKNPTIATIILFVFGLAIYALNNLPPQWESESLVFWGNILLFVMTALQGSRTTKILSEKK